MAAPHITASAWNILAASFEGEIFTDDAIRAIYATDASVYRELPIAVAYPRNEEDIRSLILFCQENGTSLIPRTAGTSLGGQCVGEGIVVDLSKYFNNIIEVNKDEQWVRVQPGVIRDDLNRFLSAEGLWFGPETSTANRAMIGGMVGNNSCGTNSLVYKTTREHTLELHTILSDGSKAVFGPLTQEEYERKKSLPGLEGEVYKMIDQELQPIAVQEEIKKEFPRAEIHRRNTGYAVDALIEAQPFFEKGEEFNFCRLLAGSEGTLAFTTEIKLHLEPIPPKDKVVVCVHFSSLQQSLEAVVAIMEHRPKALEMIDRIIMDCTKTNIEQLKNRFFIKGDPENILIVEFWGTSQEDVDKQADMLVQDLIARGMGYDYPRVYGKDINRIWSLRKAGLGLLANIPGDAKAVAVVEDTAVYVKDLPAYIAEFTEMMLRYEQTSSVYYAHAGAGELHLRPILDLKTPEGRKMFRQIASDSAQLVKKYNGSLSGEHGDGRVRGEFIPLMIGQKNYALLRRIKQVWDPGNIFNPGKIVDTPPMDTSLRYEEDHQHFDTQTIFNFNEVGGILRAAEKCNGSGDCRKSSGAGGTMCPSYMATRDEKDTTRARANILREFLTHSGKENRFDHEEIKQVMDLCLSCKGCVSECPSNVDIATLKAEFLHQYYKSNGIPLRARAIANIGKLNSLGATIPRISNFFLGNSFTSSLLKRFLGVAPQRSLPLIHHITLEQWLLKNPSEAQPKGTRKGQLYLFIDEFTNFNDVEIGIAAIRLLSGLGYEVKYVHHEESGRAYLSKGLLDEAQQLARKNVDIFKDIINTETPLVGIEPSGILSFRDEYPRLVEKDNMEAARELGKSAFLIEEFLSREAEAGKIVASAFTKESRKIKLHGHCHQKALSSTDYSAWALSLPENFHVEIIPSGCCGMAGSFGYEKEHYEVSMKVGELVLLPAVRATDQDTMIAAPGTSCRHQIKDGTGKRAFHPVEILYQALV